MRRLITLAVSVGVAVAALVASAGSAAASPYPHWESHGKAGVSGHGTYHISTYHGTPVRRVHVYVKDTQADGHVAALEFAFTKKGYQQDRVYVWNKSGYPTTAETAIASYNTTHLYIRECLGHNTAHFKPTSCGKWRIYT